MAIWHDAFDMATEALDEIERAGEAPTPDQKLAVAQIWATLSVAQELSGMVEDKGLTVRIEADQPSEHPGGARDSVRVERSPADQRVPTRSTGR